MTSVSPEKARDFMWVVQAGIMTYASSVRRSDPGREKVVEYSGSGIFIVIDEAVRAAGLIPEEKDAATAAAEFVTFWADRDAPNRSPSWFQRYGMEQISYSHLSKAEQFLWIVQTVIVCDQENQASFDAEGQHPDRYSASRAMLASQAAVRSANYIPRGTDVTEAANDFCAHFVMRERKKAPAWCRVSDHA